jgi:hypothetical protein
MRRSIAALPILLAFLLAGCIHAGRPSAERMTDDVQKLAATFPVLEEVRVRGFRNQDWCRFIDYPRGAFTNLPSGDDSDTCNLFDGKALAFDDAAKADFDRVRQELDASGVHGDWVLNVTYNAGGQLNGAEFAVQGGAFDRWSYVYDPGGTMPEDIPDEEEYAPINGDWYFWWEDWN